MNITSFLEEWLGPGFVANAYINLDTLYNAVRVYYVIIPMIFLTALAQLISQLLVDHVGVSKYVRYMTEFVVIVIPILFLTLKFHEQAGYVTIVCSVILLVLLLKTLIMKPRRRVYVTGSRRPHAYALNRAIVYVIATLGLAAPRFLDLPTYFKETYSYGVGFLDVDVGLYIFAIATIKRTGVGKSPMTSAPRFFLPMLLLSFVRMVIILINKDNDDNPISLHENYYFLFSLVVMFGSIICEHVKSPKMRIRTGLIILLCHEIILQTVSGEYLLSTTAWRFYFLTALKEVYLSIPGFMGLYLMSVGVGDKIRTRIKHLTGRMFIKRLVAILEPCASFWAMTLICIFTTSISRISCNTGYVAWIMAVGCTMTLMHMLVFSFIFNAIRYNEDNFSEEEINVVPEFVTIINKNGVLCYILGYLLAISINNFMAPKNRSENEAFCILTVFMFIMAQFSYLINNVTIFDL
ncbi:uncharacterized protein LOC105217021 [Zeugodacus cucurbitae]|uniref:Phosphatidylinositol-glycan biosynthesis class W protein n=1 Tax=Zeugodacus cucurbitae TaxID=28588 RepID=A0A0A1XGF3_ZEUCU|nr:uncharacterized protein LOC105217021 [Zeugodacus cucurbitae]